MSQFNVDIVIGGLVYDNIYIIALVIAWIQLMVAGRGQVFAILQKDSFIYTIRKTGGRKVCVESGLVVLKRSGNGVKINVLQNHMERTVSNGNQRHSFEN